MISNPLKNLYIFVVDTDTYAGGFERDMTAFCTGQIGECEVGQDFAEAFEAEYPERAEQFGNIVEQVADEHGCSRPTSIWPTPGFWNDGMGNEWPDSQKGSQETINKYRETMRAYLTQHPTSSITGGAAVDEMVPGSYSSYQSVAIFFCARPTEEQLLFLAERAAAFQKLHPFLKILDFRLLQQETIEKTLWSTRAEG